MCAKREAYTAVVNLWIEEIREYKSFEYVCKNHERQAARTGQGNADYIKRNAERRTQDAYDALMVALDHAVAMFYPGIGKLSHRARLDASARITESAARTIAHQMKKAGVLPANGFIYG